MTKEEHLERSRSRAMEYLNKGQLMNAYISFGSDLDKHSETKPNNPESMNRIFEGFDYAVKKDVQALKNWINNFI